MWILYFIFLTILKRHFPANLYFLKGGSFLGIAARILFSVSFHSQEPIFYEFQQK